MRIQTYILLTLVLLALKASIYAQGDESFNFNQLQLKHIKGVKGIEFNYGLGGNKGRYFQCGYNQFFRDKWQMGFNFNYEDVKIGETHSSSYMLRPISYFTIADIKQLIYINVSVGVFLGIENIHAYNQPDIDFNFPATNYFLYGATAGANIEIYINNKTSITINGEQYYNPGSKLGEWKFNVLGGLRLYFN